VYRAGHGGGGAAGAGRWGVYSVLLVGPAAAWMAVMSTFNTATQTSVPPWVRARATAMHTLCALGGFAIGSAFWGALSDIAGLRRRWHRRRWQWPPACCWRGRFPLRMGEAARSRRSRRPENLFIVHEPDPEAGPVAVEIGYRVAPRTPTPSSTPCADLLRRPPAARRRDLLARLP
jgi:hypothetical protein